MRELLYKNRDTDLISADDARLAGGASVVVGQGTERLDILLISVGDKTTAYLNQCPHAQTPLETMDGRFLDRNDPTTLVCSTHGARFRRSDGVCIKGPCKGKGLTSISISERDGRIKLKQE